MVVVAQLVESRIVIPVVVGSSPIDHPMNSAGKLKGYKFMLVAFFVFISVFLRYVSTMYPDLKNTSLPHIVHIHFYL